MLDSHSRPVAPVSIGSEPWMFEEPIRWFVKLIRAVMPGTERAASALWMALASGRLGGTGPVPAAAMAIAVPAAMAVIRATTRASSRRVETVRRNFVTTPPFS